MKDEDELLFIEMTPFPQMGVYDQVAGDLYKLNRKFDIV